MFLLLLRLIADPFIKGENNDSWTITHQQVYHIGYPQGKAYGTYY